MVVEVQMMGYVGVGFTWGYIPKTLLVTVAGIVLRVDGENYSGIEVEWYRGDQDRYSRDVQ